MMKVDESLGREAGKHYFAISHANPSSRSLPWIHQGGFIFYFQQEMRLVGTSSSSSSSSFFFFFFFFFQLITVGEIGLFLQPTIASDFAGPCCCDILCWFPCSLQAFTLNLQVAEYMETDCEGSISLRQLIYLGIFTQLLQQTQIIQIQIFWDVTLRQLVGSFQRFIRLQCLYLHCQGKRW